MAETLQIVGAFGILIPFVLVQMRRLVPESLVYLLLNFVGAGLLAVAAALGRDWGFLLLEGVWAATAAWGIATYLLRGPSPRPGGSKGSGGSL